jgi:hypothetical protein
MIWKFTKGTLKAHAIIDEAEGTTVCGRKGLKFEAAAPDYGCQSYRCKTCVKGVAKQK